MLLAAPVAASAQVVLAWDPAPDKFIAGYTIFYGTRSAEYQMQIDVGNRTQFQMPPLPDGTYYIAVQAYAIDGLRSGPSNEVVVTVRASRAVDSSAAEKSRADFDGDGSYDLLWQHQNNGTVALWTLDLHNLKTVQVLGNGVGNNSPWRIVGTGDFNRDGKPDILWHHATGGWLALWLMNGTSLTAVTAPSLNQVPQTEWKISAVADFNRDGNPDILWRHDDGSLAAWLMNGTTVTAISPLSPGGLPDLAWKVAGAADINADGHQDLIWRHTNGSLAAWLMNELTLKAVAPLNPGIIDPNWRIAGIADANRDGLSDIIWQHTDGRIALWYMSGTDLTQTVALNPPGVSDTNWKVVGPK
jgi:hypothetical protein